MSDISIASFASSSARYELRAFLIIVGILISMFIAPDLFADNVGSNLLKADSLLAQGDFDEAYSLYDEITEINPQNYLATLNKGKILLYKNDLQSAEELLKIAVELDTSSVEPKALLAEAFYRQDRFAEAAPLFRAAGKLPMAEKLEYFGERKPYRIQFPPSTNYIEFVQTDPLPVVRMRLNDSDEALFLIDTGGWELTVDTDFADSVGAVKFGGQQATYAGGKRAVTYHGFLDSIQIGEIKIANVPVNINDSVKRIADAFGMPIKGVVGTVFLYHFIFTLDYPNNRLILVSRSTGEPVNAPVSSETTAVPFYLAGDHIILAKAKVNDLGPYLFFLDTGMAGGGFTATDWLVEKAGIKLSDEVRQGIGGGGAVQIRSGIVDKIELGDAVERHVVGLFGGMPPDFGKRLGLDIAGIISHGFLRPYSVTFDFDTMTITLKKATSE